MSSRAPIHLLMLSLDESLFTPEKSDALNRHRHYASFFKKLSIYVYAKKSHPPIIESNIEIHSITGYPLTQFIKSIFFARKIHQKEKIQLITAQDPLLTGLIGVKLKKLLKAKLNIQLHSDFHLNPKWIGLRFIHRFYIPFINSVLKNADSIRVVTESAKNKLSKLYPAKIFTAPIKVDLDLYWKNARYRPKVNKFIFVGRLVAEKNIGTLIEAFTDAAKTNPDATLTIVGDGPEKQNLKTQSNGQNILFLGHKNPAEVAELLHGNDVYIQTSYYEGWGRTYVEAFAAGLPVISTPVTAVGELLQPETNCLIANRPPELVLHIKQLISRPEEAYRLAKNGQMWVKQNLDSQVLTKAWIDGLYET